MGTLDTICGSHALETLLFLGKGPRMENDFREILGYYVAQRTLATLVDAGLVERFELERSKARRYRLTDSGRVIVDAVLDAVSKVDGEPEEMGTSGDTPPEAKE